MIFAGLRSFHVASRNENLQNPDENVQNKDIKTGENVANCENKDIKINPLFLNRNPRYDLCSALKGCELECITKCTCTFCTYRNELHAIFVK